MHHLLYIIGRGGVEPSQIVVGVKQSDKKLSDYCKVTALLIVGSCGKRLLGYSWVFCGFLVVRVGLNE